MFRAERAEPHPEAGYSGPENSTSLLGSDRYSHRPNLSDG